MIRNLSVGCTYTVTLKALSRPGYPPGKLSVLWDDTDVMPPTLLLPSAVEATPQTFGPFPVKARLEAHTLRVLFVGNGGEESAMLLDSIHLRPGGA